MAPRQLDPAIVNGQQCCRCAIYIDPIRWSINRPASYSQLCEQADDKADAALLTVYNLFAPAGPELP